MTAVILQESVWITASSPHDATDAGPSLASSSSAGTGVAVVRARVVGPFLMVGAAMRKRLAGLTPDKATETTKVPYFLIFYIGRDDRDTMLRLPSDAQPSNTGTVQSDGLREEGTPVDRGAEPIEGGRQTVPRCFRVR